MSYTVYHFQDVTICLLSMTLMSLYDYGSP